MPNELVSMADQFSGLPMESLIGGPLQAACKAEVMLAAATTNFIETIGFEEAEKDKDGNITGPRKAKTVAFTFERPATSDNMNQDPTAIGSETVTLEVPVLSIVNIPSLMVQSVDVTFDMEVKSSVSSQQTSDKSGTLDATAKLGWGVFSLDVTIKGSISSHESNTRSSDNSAKYHVSVQARQAGTPEGLSRVLDILTSAVQPKTITPKKNSGDDSGGSGGSGGGSGGSGGSDNPDAPVQQNVLHDSENTLTASRARG